MGGSATRSAGLLARSHVGRYDSCVPNPDPRPDDARAVVRHRVTRMPSLILLKSPGGGGPDPGKVFPLDPGKDSYTIGRDAEQCEIVVANSAVSRRHAVIHRADGRYVLEDLGSRNHTFLNQNKVTAPTPLKSEDRVKICDFLFRFVDEAAPRFPPPVAPAALPTHETTIHSTVSRGDAGKFLDVQPTERLRALLDISTGLARTLELDPLLTQVADTLFGVFRQADRCFVILLDDANRLIPKEVKTRRPNTGDDRFSQTIVRRCLDTGQSFLTEDATSDSALGGSQSIAEFRIRSAMCVPLMTADGKRLGAIQLDTQDVTKKFKDDDLKLLTIVANLASVSIEKAQVHAELVVREKQQKEIEVARKVQIGFLPKAFPPLAGFEFFAFYSPAQTVGGDYYDFITLPGGRVAVVLGDVAGKGVAAALLMAKLSAEVRFSVLTEPDPAKAVCLLNEQLIRGGIGDRFVTLALLVVDPTAEQVTVVNAGHINPVRVRHDAADVVEVISNKESGLPLGLVPGFPYEAKVLPVQHGDTLMVFTDGVTDAESPAGARFNPEGITRALYADAIIGADTRPYDIGDRVIRAVQRHAAGQPQSDDIAMVCFGRVEGAAPSRTTSRAPRVLESMAGSPRETL